MKLKTLTPKQRKLLDKFIDTAEIFMFDKKEIAKKIKLSYSKREIAHKLMLDADILLDEVLTELYGETKNTKSS